MKRAPGWFWRLGYTALQGRTSPPATAKLRRFNRGRTLEAEEFCL